MIDRIKKKEILEEEEETDGYAGRIVDGVEVVDVKAITGLEIPETEKRKTWDKP